MEIQYEYQIKGILEFMPEKGSYITTIKLKNKKQIKEYLTEQIKKEKEKLNKTTNNKNISGIESKIEKIKLEKKNLDKIPKRIIVYKNYGENRILTKMPKHTTLENYFTKLLKQSQSRI